MRLLQLTTIALFFQFGNQLHAQVEFLVSIDPVTGIHTKIDSIPGVAWIQANPNVTTYDHINGNFIFSGTNNTSWGLYTVDTSSGEVESNPDFPALADNEDNIVELKFDNSSGNLYGLHWDASTETEYLVTVDQMTGTHQIVTTIPDVKWITLLPNYATFDHVNGRYIFRGANAEMVWRLYSIDVITGDIVSSPEFPILSDPSDNIGELQFDNDSEMIYALHWDASEELEYFVSVDPETGTHTIIESIPGVDIVVYVPNYTTYDHLNGRFIFLGADSGFNTKLYTIDSATGSIISSPTFPILEDPADNILELQFDNNTGILYGLHWDANIILDIGNNEYSSMTQVYPNPFNDKATIKLDRVHDNVTVKIFDSTGRIVRIINKNNVQMIEITKGDLVPGVYFTNISSDKNNSLKKVIIE